MQRDIAKSCLPLILILFLLSIGCIGDRAMPIVSQVRIGNSKYSVLLHGPTRNGTYYYTVDSPEGRYLSKNLGIHSIKMPVKTTCNRIGEEIYQITWDDGLKVVLIELDLGKEIVVINGVDSEEIPFALR